MLSQWRSDTSKFCHIIYREIYRNTNQTLVDFPLKTNRLHVHLDWYEGLAFLRSLMTSGNECIQLMSHQNGSCCPTTHLWWVFLWDEVISHFLIEAGLCQDTNREAALICLLSYLWFQPSCVALRLIIITSKTLYPDQYGSFGQCFDMVVLKVVQFCMCKPIKMWLDK